MNVCPQCKQVTLSLDDDAEIKCPICETKYTVTSNDDTGEGEK